MVQVESIHHSYSEMIVSVLQTDTGASMSTNKVTGTVSFRTGWGFDELKVLRSESPTNALSNKYPGKLVLVPFSAVCECT